MVDRSAVRFGDVLYFLAELAVYTAVVWWALTRDVATPLRWVLAIGGLAVFAISWGLLAAPRASFALHGAPDVIFRVLWFGCGVVAAIAVVSSAIAAG